MTSKSSTKKIKQKIAKLIAGAALVSTLAMGINKLPEEADISAKLIQKLLKRTNLFAEKDAEELANKMVYEMYIQTGLLFIRGFHKNFDSVTKDIGMALSHFFANVDEDKYYSLDLTKQLKKITLHGNKKITVFNVLKTILENMSDYQYLKQTEIFLNKRGNGKALLANSSLYKSLNKKYHFTEQQNAVFTLLAYIRPADLTKLLTQLEKNDNTNINQIFSVLAQNKTSIEDIAILYWLDLLYTGKLDFDTVRKNMKAESYVLAITNGKTMSLKDFKKQVFDATNNFITDANTVAKYTRNANEKNLKTRTIDDNNQTPYIGDILANVLDKINNPEKEKKRREAENILVKILDQNGFKPQTIKIDSPLFQENKIETFNVFMDENGKPYADAREATKAFQQKYERKLLHETEQTETYFPGLYAEGTCLGISRIWIQLDNEYAYQFKLTNFNGPDGTLFHALRKNLGKKPVAKTWFTQKTEGYKAEWGLPDETPHVFLILPNGELLDGYKIFDKYFKLIPTSEKIKMVTEHFENESLLTVITQARTTATQLGISGNIPVSDIFSAHSLSYQLPEDGKKAIDFLIRNPNASIAEKTSKLMNYSGDGTFEVGSAKRRINNLNIAFNLVSIDELGELNIDSAYNIDIKNRMTIYTESGQIVDVLGMFEPWWIRTHKKNIDTAETFLQKLENNKTIINIDGKKVLVTERDNEQLAALEQEIIRFMTSFMLQHPENIMKHPVSKYSQSIIINKNLENNLSEELLKLIKTKKQTNNITTQKEEKETQEKSIKIKQKEILKKAKQELKQRQKPQGKPIQKTPLKKGRESR